MHLRTLGWITLAAVVSLGAVACGGGGGGGAAPTVAQTTPPPAPAPVEDKTGVIAIALKDAPTDDFLKILMVVRSVELLGADGPVTVFTGRKEIDLLALENYYEMLAVSDRVPVGVYQKIRLRVESIDVVKDNGDGTMSDPIPLDVPANGKIDLNPRGSFDVKPGVALLVEIDVDAKKSVHVVGAGKDRYRFRPVVFVDIQERQLLNGLVRVHGTVGDIADDNAYFELCDVEIQFDSAKDHCLIVNVIPDETSLFDDNGDPIDIEYIRNEAPPVEATVYGLAVVSEDPDDGDSDSDSDGDGDSESDSESDSDSDSDRDSVRMVQIDAIVVQLGPDSAALQLDGTVLNDIDSDDQFGFGIDPGQGFTEDSEVTVQVQPSTKILSEDLTVLDTSAIVTEARASVAGVLDLSDSNLLKSTLIIIEDEEEDDDERLNGPVLEFEDSVFYIGTNEGNRCVSPTEDAEFYYFEDDEGLFKEDGLNDMRERFDDGPLNSTVYGEDDDVSGCFQADLVFYYRPDDEPDEI